MLFKNVDKLFIGRYKSVDFLGKKNRERRKLRENRKGLVFLSPEIHRLLRCFYVTEADLTFINKRERGLCGY